jgi:hypothetical protein
MRQVDLFQLVAAGFGFPVPVQVQQELILQPELQDDRECYQ